ncbi:MAG: TonB-dependent receptor [Burkholderiales bacterium]
MRHVVFAGFALAAQVSLLGAEELPLYRLPDVVVTASRFPESLLGKAVNMSVITATDIEQAPQSTLPELLARQAGIGTRDLFGNNASNATVDLRGFGAAGGQNNLILLDGQRIADIDLSSVQWSAVPLESIDRVEVMRGGAAVLYGSGASGGVVNIVTKNSLKPGNSLNLGYTMGSHTTRVAAAGANYGNGKLGINLSADHRHSAGYRDNNDNEQDDFAARFAWRLDNTELRLRLAGDRQDLRLPGPRLVQPSIGLDELRDDRRGTGTPFDFASRDGNNVNASLNQGFGWGELHADVAFRDKEQKSFFDFGGFPDYRIADLRVWSFTPRVRVPLQWQDNSVSSVAGVDFHRWDYKLRTSNAVANIAQPINRVQATQDTLALYFQANVRFGSSTSLSAGARSETFDMEANDVFDPTAPGAAFGSAAAAGSQREHEYAWEFGLRHAVTDALALHAKLGRSYRFATVDEIYEFSPTFSREFQFLRPQTSNDGEIGAQYRRGNVLLRGSLYYLDVKNEIHLDPFSSGIGNTNLPPLRRYGIELESRWEFQRFALQANYTLAYARFRNGTLRGVDISDNHVPLVSRNKANMNLSWALNESTRIGASAAYVGEQYLDNDETNDFDRRIPSYVVLDAGLRYQQGPLRAQLSITNLLDREYYNYAIRSAFVPDRFATFPLPERGVSFTVEYTL